VYQPLVALWRGWWLWWSLGWNPVWDSCLSSRSTQVSVHIYFFTYGLFNYAIINLTVYCQMARWIMNWKGCGWKPISVYSPDIHLELLRKTMKILSKEDSHCFVCDIRTGHILNVSQKCDCLRRFVQCVCLHIWTLYFSWFWKFIYVSSYGNRNTWIQSK
jgi:hypothetical protein